MPYQVWFWWRTRQPRRSPSQLPNWLKLAEACWASHAVMAKLGNADRPIIYQQPVERLTRAQPRAHSLAFEALAGIVFQASPYYYDAGLGASRHAYSCSTPYCLGMPATQRNRFRAPSPHSSFEAVESSSCLFICHAQRTDYPKQLTGYGEEAHSNYH